MFGDIQETLNVEKGPPDMVLDVFFMIGVASGPFELKHNSFILIRRGGADVNAPESPRRLCCEIGNLDSWIAKCWKTCPNMVSPKMNIEAHGSRIGRFEE